VIAETRARLLRVSSQVDLSRDRIAFARAAGFEPEPWQARFLASSAPRVVLNITRQGGKSQTASILAIHTVMFEPESMVLLLSPTLRQSTELFKKCLSVYRALGRPVPADSETALTLSLENGSRIVSLPGSEGSIRGYSNVRLLLEDESSRVPDDVHLAALPMVGRHGRLILMSTPFGSRGHFYERFKHGGDRWERYEIPATESAQYTPERLQEAREDSGAWWFDQEYLVKFMDAQSAAFRTEDIARAFAEEVEVWSL